jgi:uracil-DNA glycosylase
MVNIGNDWDELLGAEWEKPYYLDLRRFLKSEYAGHTIYPDMHDIFNALRYTAYQDVKAVILGQDPYHGPGQAHGLCFSVKPGVPPPPSLVNIFKELSHEYPVRSGAEMRRPGSVSESIDAGSEIGVADGDISANVTDDRISADVTDGDIPFTFPDNGYLVPWAERGVLLLNTVLTVREGQANSHKGKGWEQLTDRVIELLNKRDAPMAFILWGANARAKKALITNPNHLVLESPHPSPLSASSGFFGCGHFRKANDFLASHGGSIDWTL